MAPEKSTLSAKFVKANQST